LPHPNYAALLADLRDVTSTVGPIISVYEKIGRYIVPVEIHFNMYTYFIKWWDS